MKNHETELYKDKIEVSLDGRQIFYLFFGGAVIASMVFVLGVMIGKRLETRANVRASAQTSAAQDPLTALDKLSASRQALAFPAALTQAGSSPLGAVDRVIAARAEGVAAVPADKAAKATAAKDKAAKAEAAKAKAAKAAKAQAARAAKASAEPTRGMYTLQLSSFRDRGEADAFHAKLTGSGYSAYVVAATVKGEPWYRVRLGRYGNYREAISAKGRFESKQKIIAYVTRLK